MFLLAGNKGFTFIEVLLVIGIIGVLVGLAIPFYQSFQVSSQLDNSTQEIVQTLRRAQARSMASESLSAFGVHFAGRKFVLFQGAIYNPADPLNEAVDLPNTLTITPATDVVFSMTKGIPDSTNSILISTSGESKTITINELGVVNVL